MAEEIPNLWPADRIFVSAVSPVAILRAQGQYLQGQTLGLLYGEVTTIEVGTSGGQNGKPLVIYHYFEIVAPRLRGYRSRVLKIRQDTALPYPVLYSELPEEAGDPLRFHPDVVLLEAGTEAEFMAFAAQVFSSRPVLSVISSLLTQINAMRPEAVTSVVEVGTAEELQWDEQDGEEGG